MRARRHGFTLVEVMLALAILAVALVVLVKSIAGNITTASESYHLGVATDLARGKMYDLEEQLALEGYQEGEQELEGDFAEEGWPGVTWKAVITPTELPSFDKLMAVSQGTAEGGEAPKEGEEGKEGKEGESGAVDKFQSSALGGMMSMFGGAPGDAMFQQQYTMIQTILKASIRKITLTVHYTSGVRKDQFDVVLYVTDPAGMAKTLGPLWKQ